MYALCMHGASVYVYVYGLLGGLNRAVGAPLWGAVVPVEQQAGDRKANEGPVMAEKKELMVE
jgi:hypothetical protein